MNESFKMSNMSKTVKSRVDTDMKQSPRSSNQGNLSHTLSQNVTPTPRSANSHLSFGSKVSLPYSSIITAFVSEQTGSRRATLCGG